MYGASILQATDARPTFATVTPLYQKSVLRGKLNSLLAALTGRPSQLTGGQPVCLVAQPLLQSSSYHDTGPAFGCDRLIVL